MSTDASAAPAEQPPAATERERLVDRLALWDAIEEAANQLHPHRAIPEAQLRQREAQIARDGESGAAWDIDVLSGLLAEAQRLAVGEGLFGLAVTLEQAMRLLDEAETLYAFAGRDESETDVHVNAANLRWFGPAATVTTHHGSPGA